MDFHTNIGLEIHVELNTESKLFCSCSVRFGAEPNTQCCPVCMGLPGALPVLNKTAVDYAIKAGLALNCSISDESAMDRKAYFYPDMPKAYQSTQFYMPQCKDGYLDITQNSKAKRIRISRIHLEEDAGKLIHDKLEGSTLVDYNRAGVPLIEIVTEPDIESAEEAAVFLESLKNILEYIEVSDCKMEEGSLRCDINLSTRPTCEDKLGTRTEMKNLSSFRAVQRAIEHEAARQIGTLKSGVLIRQETRRWDEQNNCSYSMRSKGEAVDYRYFPNPDIPVVTISKDEVRKIADTLPELPEAKRCRYIEDLYLPAYDAAVLTSSRHLASYFEACLKLYNNPKTLSNWLMGDLLRLIKTRGTVLHNQEEQDVGTVLYNQSEREMGTVLYNSGTGLESIPVSPENLTKLLEIIDQGVISITAGKIVFDEMYITGEAPEVIIDKLNLSQITDEEQLLEIIDAVLSDNQQAIEDYKNGKTKVFGFLIGQIMRAAKGRANPNKANELLKSRLG